MYKDRVQSRRNPSQGNKMGKAVQQRKKIGGQFIMIWYGVLQSIRIRSRVK